MIINYKNIKKISKNLSQKIGNFFYKNIDNNNQKKYIKYNFKNKYILYYSNNILYFFYFKL